MARRQSPTESGTRPDLRRLTDLLSPAPFSAGVSLLFACRLSRSDCLSRCPVGKSHPGCPADRAKAWMERMGSMGGQLHSCAGLSALWVLALGPGHVSADSPKAATPQQGRQTVVRACNS